MNSNSTPSILHIYTRVSTLVQADKGTSLQSQLELGKEKATELGFNYQHWDEGGKSSHHDDIAGRPVLFELYNAIRDGQVKHLWVYDQSRLSRNDQVASVLRYECNKQGVTLYTKDGQFDLSSPQDKFLKQLLDAVAELDNVTRAERTRLGKLNRVRAGYWHGGPPPFGYKLDNRKLAINEDEAKWVRIMFTESLKGESARDLKAVLDSNAVSPRRGGLWTLGSIDALLRNSHYIGYYKYRDKKSDSEIEVQCPAIVDTVLWQSVQLAKKRVGNRQSQQNPTKKFYLLRDLMYCAHCGRPLSGRKNAGKAEAIYYCPNKERTWAKNGGSETPCQRGTGCGFSRSMNIYRADELVWNLVTDLHRKSSVLREEVKRRSLKQHGLEQAADEKQTKKLAARVRKLQQDVIAVSETIGNLEANRLMKRMDEISYKTLVSRLSEEKDRLNEQLNAARLELQGGVEKKRFVDWFKNFGKEVEKTSQFNDEERKQYVEGLIERIDVKWLEDTREHELVLHFRLPIVNDRIEWRDPKKKSLGYDLHEGENQAILSISKKDGRG